MNEQLFYVGFTYKTTPIALRERLRLEVEQQDTLLDALRDAAPERVILSTCGRFEIYAVTTQLDLGHWCDQLEAHGLQSVGLACKTLDSYAQPLIGDRCTEHLLRVAAGLESQVIGEPQILSQVRRAFLRATESGSIGPVLSALFRAAIHAGKRVRNETAITALAPSLGKISVEHIERHLDTLQERTVLVVGSGRMAGDVAACLASENTGRIVIVNRDMDRARALALRVGGVAVGIGCLPTELSHANAAVVCTSSHSFIIDRGTVKQRNGAPICIVDLGVPRNVDPSVAAIPGVQLTHLDDLTSGRDLRRAASPLVGDGQSLDAAERIISEELDRFCRWQRARRVAPLICELVGRTKVDNAVSAGRRKLALHRSIMRLKGGIAA